MASVFLCVGTLELNWFKLHSEDDNKQKQMPSHTVITVLLLSLQRRWTTLLPKFPFCSVLESNNSAHLVCFSLIKRGIFFLFDTCWYKNLPMILKKTMRMGGIFKPVFSASERHYLCICPLSTKTSIITTQLPCVLCWPWQRMGEASKHMLKIYANEWIVL